MATATLTPADLQNASATVSVDPPQPPCRCVCSAGTVPFYRLFSGHHFYTINLAERDTASKGGFTTEGIAAYVWPSQRDGTVPLFRLYHPALGDHLYTTSAEERDKAIGGGYKSEGTACFVLTWQGCGTIPLFRVYLASNGDHFYTTSASERDAAIKGGYKDEGIAAFVFPVPS